MSSVKISVENIDSNKELKLHEIDKSKSLDENIKSVCEIFEKPASSNTYGLKLLSTNDGTRKDYYVSEENFNDIKDAYFLKLVYSVKYYAKIIFENISNKEFIEVKRKGFEDLYRLSVEPEFIKELVRTKNHLVLINYFTNSELEGTEVTACLIAILHLFKKNFITEISSEFLNKIISIVKSESTPKQEEYALSVLHKVLVHRDQTFSQWKQEIIKQLPISELLPFIWSEEHTDLQYGALLVINSLIRCCKGDMRFQLIKEISKRQNRELIYKHIIVSSKVDKAMEHELYVFQTYLLSIYNETLNARINLDNNQLFDREEFEIDDGEIKRATVLMDFDEISLRNRNPSIENLLEANDMSRISLASLSSMRSEVSRDRLDSTSTLDNFDDYTISILTLEGLRHYKKYHSKNFLQSQVEEIVYQPGIFITSDRIMALLAKILHIGVEPTRNNSLYQPIIFNCSATKPFLFELFARTMWLLSKTRREMKASTFQDYEKVIRVVEKQVKLVLEEKPMDFKILTQKMINVTYHTVMKQWQKEKDEEMDVTLETNPSVQELKERYTIKNKEFVYDHRMNYVMRGKVFPKIVDKKITGNFVAKVASNMRELIIYDYDPKTKLQGEAKSYPISDITHVVEERACPHVINNMVKEACRAFSIVIEHTEYINFIAADNKVKCYWVDAIYLLQGRNNALSAYYRDELKQLVKMDLLLHLMELQDITIPKKPPPIPPSPFLVKPPLPPRPTN